MRRPIDPATVTRLLNQGKSPPEIAKELNVNRTSVYRVIKDVKRHAPKVVALEKADKYVDHQINLMDQYKDAMRSLNRLKDGLEKYIYDGDRTIFSAMQRKFESKSMEQGGDDDKAKGRSGNKSRIEQRVEKFDFGVDPKMLLVQVNRAIKEYLSLQIDIMNACADPHVMMGTLNRIIQVMGKVAPEVRHRIEEALKEDQLIRSIITFDSADQGDLRS